MKKTIVFSFLLLLAAATACTTPKTQNLTYGEFIENIWDFKENPDSLVFKGNTAVIIDYYAKWCRSCVNLLPIMEKMAEEYEGDLIVYKVDIEKEEALAKQFRVRGLPVMYVIPKNGEYIKRYDGLPTEAELRRIIEEELIN